MSWFRDTLARSLLETDVSRPDARRRRPATEPRPRLGRPVGPGQANRPDDVAGLESALGAEGYLDVTRARRPLGRLDSDLDASIRQFQADNALAVDGRVTPSGPTFGTLVRRLRETLPKARSRPLDAAATAENARLARALRRSGDLGSVPKLVADAHLAGGDTDAELDDLFGQLRDAAPARADALYRAASNAVAARTGRPLAAARFPALLADDDAPDKPDEPDTEEPENDEPEGQAKCTAEWVDLYTAYRKLDDVNRQIRAVDARIERAEKNIEDLESGRPMSLPPTGSLPPTTKKSKPRGGKGGLISLLFSAVGSGASTSNAKHQQEDNLSRNARIAELRAEITALELEEKALEKEKKNAERLVAEQTRRYEECKSGKDQSSRSQRLG